MKARALWHINETNSEIKEESLQEENILVKAKYSYISLGTEYLICTGNVPLSLYDNMRVNYMTGDFSFPIKYGYSLVGECEKGLVHLMHPHQDIMSVKEEDLYILPDNLSSERATMISNMETVINAIWDADLKGGEKILIIGFGSLGALLAVTLKYHYKNDIVIKEKSITKRKIIGTLGIKSDITDSSNEYDVVFNTTASYDALQYAISHTSMDGKIIELSWYGNKAGTIHLGADFHYKRQSIISSQVSNISPLAPQGTTYKSRKDHAVRLLIDDIYDTLITRVISFVDAPELYSQLRQKKLQDEVCVLFKYD